MGQIRALVMLVGAVLAIGVPAVTYMVGHHNGVASCEKEQAEDAVGQHEQDKALKAEEIAANEARSERNAERREERQEKVIERTKKVTRYVEVEPDTCVLPAEWVCLYNGGGEECTGKAGGGSDEGVPAVPDGGAGQAG